MQTADLALGRWPDLLTRFGVARHLLTGKHSPCPLCGGRDRFRFDDKGGRGTFYCSHCGAGDGFDLLRLLNGWDFKESASQVEAIVGTIPARAPKSTQDASRKIETCRRIWSESKAVIAGDPVHAYLANRTGIENVPACIRFHPDLPYRQDDGKITRHPAMLAKVTDADGNGSAIHRTYLTMDGHKANVPTAKKIVGSLPPSSAIRLLPDDSALGIAEGIETALSASVMFDITVWAAISAGGLEKWTPPIGIERVMVFGDNDANGTGQAASWSLAKRLIASGITVTVSIPETTGHDWNDIYLQGIQK